MRRDHAHVRVDVDAAIEAGDLTLELQRLDEHLHAARRPTAGERKRDACAPKLLSRGDRILGEHFLLRDQGAVHVGDDQANHDLRSVGGTTGRHLRPPSRAISSSAAGGPSLPET